MPDAISSHLPAGDTDGCLESDVADPGCPLVLRYSSQDVKQLIGIIDWVLEPQKAAHGPAGSAAAPPATAQASRQMSGTKVRQNRQLVVLKYYNSAGVGDEDFSGTKVLQKRGTKVLQKRRSWR